MKLNIEVESSSFEKFIAEGIESLSLDERKDIIKQVILEAFTKCTSLRDLLIQIREPRYGGPTTEVLGHLAEAAVKSIDLEKELAPIKEKMVKALMENHQKIVEDVLLKQFVTNIAYSDTLRQAMAEVVNQILYEARNNG